MNPGLDPDVIAAAREEDPARARAEFDAEFRDDIAAFMTREVVDACTVPGCHELLPVSGIRCNAFCDPSGGSADSFTLAIAHAQGDLGVLDAVREIRPPFSPEGAVTEFAALMKTYRIHEVVGDRYAGEWPREQFRKHGIEYRIAEKPSRICIATFCRCSTAARWNCWIYRGWPRNCARWSAAPRAAHAIRSTMRRAGTTILPTLRLARCSWYEPSGR